MRGLATALIVAILVMGIPTGVQAQDEPPPWPVPAVHVVAEGETLESIAALYQVAVADLRVANGLSPLEAVGPGQRLLIPRTAYAGPAPGALFTLVGMGDTLEGLAARHGIAPRRLAAVNGMVNPARLLVGQTLQIPPAEGRGLSGERHVIYNAAGEALWRLSMRYDVPLFDLLLYNDLDNPAFSPPGTLIVLPGEGPAPTLAGAPWVSLDLNGLPFLPGYSAGFTVTTSVPGVVQAAFADLTIPVASQGTIHQAVFGIPRRLPPGVYPLTLTFDDGAGTTAALTRSVLVNDAGYATEQIRLRPEIEAVLSDRDLVAGEQLYIQQSMTGYSAERRWEGLFLRPSTGVLTSRFGVERVYNNTDLNTFHSGTDLAAPVGTPVYAPAPGRVVDTGLLDVRGYIIILDHGWGVYTGYWHLASILVNPGDEVTAGQMIGTMGTTGLSTASHLHWEMWVNGQPVDATQWLREELP
ncbi:MAG: hypothetical protein Kow00124_04880 [Anaerolineae bacterium]